MALRFSADHLRFIANRQGLQASGFREADADALVGQRHNDECGWKPRDDVAPPIFATRAISTSDSHQSVNSAQSAVQYKAMEATIEIQRRTSSRVIFDVSQTNDWFSGAHSSCRPRARALAEQPAPRLVNASQ
jgi:hypothetical protein